MHELKHGDMGNSWFCNSKNPNLLFYTPRFRKVGVGTWQSWADNQKKSTILASIVYGIHRFTSRAGVEYLILAAICILDAFEYRFNIPKFSVLLRSRLTVTMGRAGSTGKRDSCGRVLAVNLIKVTLANPLYRTFFIFLPITGTNKDWLMKRSVQRLELTSCKTHIIT